MLYDQKLKKTNYKNSKNIQTITYSFNKETKAFFKLFKELSKELSFFHIFTDSNICKLHNLKNKINLF